MSRRVGDPDKALRDLKLTMPEPVCGPAEVYAMPIIRAPYPKLPDFNLSALPSEPSVPNGHDILACMAQAVQDIYSGKAKVPLFF